MSGDVTRVVQAMETFSEAEPSFACTTRVI